MNLEALEEDRQSCEASSTTQTRERRPFPRVGFSKLHSGKYLMRIPAATEGRNPYGLFPFSQYKIPVSSVDPKKTFNFLHPRSLRDRKGPEAYWGIHNMILDAKAMTDDNDEPILNNPVLKEIFDKLNTYDMVWLPVLINAVPATTRYDGSPVNPKYPEYIPNPNPNGKMVDLVLEIDKKRKYYDDLYDLIRKHPEIDSYRDGWLVEVTKQEKSTTFRLVEQSPMSPYEREYCQKKYPDLFEEAAKPWFHQKPQVVYDAIKETWWWKALEPLQIFTLDPPVSPLSGLKMKKAAPASDKQVDVLNAAISKKKEKATSESPVIEYQPVNLGTEDFDDVPF